MMNISNSKKSSCKLTIVTLTREKSPSLKIRKGTETPQDPLLLQSYLNLLTLALKVGFVMGHVV